MRDTLADEYLKDVRNRLGELKSLAEGALAQISDDDLFRALDEESNSVAVLLKHMAGNMQTRWRHFPQEGETETSKRNRDAEFVIDDDDTKNTLRTHWEDAWRCAFNALDSLTPRDMDKAVIIRGESLSTIAAINRQMTHCAYHIGQIVFLAKHLGSSQWQSLTIPRGKSDEFAVAMRKKHEA